MDSAIKRLYLTTLPYSVYATICMTQQHVRIRPTHCNFVPVWQMKGSCPEVSNAKCSNNSFGIHCTCGQ